MADHTEDGSRWLCKLPVCVILTQSATEDAFQNEPFSLNAGT